MTEVRYRVQLPHGDAEQFARFGPGWCDLEVREGTSDEDVLREVWIEDCYRVRGLDKRYWQARALEQGEHLLKGAVEIERGATIIDVGACTGIFSALCLAFGATHVIAVEPEPDNLQLLARNTEHWSKRVTILPYAIAAERGTVKLWGGEGTGHTEPGAQDGGLAVDAITLAEVIDRAGGPVALLKVDVEGAEYGALRACPSETLAHVEHVAMEFHGPAMGCSWVTDPAGQYGAMVAHLARTHAVSAFGDPERGGMIFAHRYESAP